MGDAETELDVVTLVPIGPVPVYGGFEWHGGAVPCEVVKVPVRGRPLKLRELVDVVELELECVIAEADTELEVELSVLDGVE